MTKSTTAATAADYAVFTEYSPASKPVTGFWNTRVFTDVTSQVELSSIKCDFTNGYVWVAPGLYHITGLSTVAYNSGGEPPEMSTIRAPAAAGYCRLRTFTTWVDPDPILDSDPSVLCIGSVATANMTPSLIDTYFENKTGDWVSMVLEHQAGHNPPQVYLRVFVQDSPWHVFSRISLRRL